MRLRFDSRAVGIGALLTLMGCSAAGSSESFPGRAYDGAPSSSGSSSSTGGSGTAGLLTAGVWDDNVNYDHFVDYRDGSASHLPFTADEQDAAHERFGGQRAGHVRLDVALVIDTTGSMSDELSYLQTELDSIATRVTAAYPDAGTRWALVVYRDEGDEYVTRTFDFETLDAMRSHLAAQSAGGGGDYPEASHAALADMTNLAWREGTDVARVSFWIADAPHHDERVTEWAEAVRTAAQLDVHVYPIASSGVDEGTELSMRSAAQLTGGRYVFLTDDSGIGGSHLEPSIPCYFVTHLDQVMLRTMDAEMTGEHSAPAPEQVIRSAGEPTEAGVCTLGEGTTAYAF